MEGNVSHASDPSVSKTFLTNCSDLRENGYVVLKGHTCKIVAIRKFHSPAKYGTPKVHLVGIEVFTGETLEDIFQAGRLIEVPSVNIKEYQLLKIFEDGHCTVKEGAGEIRTELSLVNGREGEQIREIYEKGGELLVTVLSTMNKEIIVGYKNLTTEKMLMGCGTEGLQ
ncbi:hypothetical protein CHS0354_004198 [Potamilus streckersoni]|uniref:Translation initiation factor 5A C-terminal domain-containing protein n=2 Tax=Potamilus streckersoni TaxID=2493646 RepID=A0AAE0T0E7_9BIVA|nr:hypothetical protein CHS0354_004198 [Potamilus streckersoni]